MIFSSLSSYERYIIIEISDTQSICIVNLICMAMFNIHLCVYVCVWVGVCVCVGVCICVCVYM